VKTVSPGTKGILDERKALTQIEERDGTPQTETSTPKTDRGRIRS
jgi:hypothetical protein